MGAFIENFGNSQSHDGRGWAKPNHDSPIQLVLNYWEKRPSQVRSRLDDFARHGVTHFATFVPWQAVESDISHTLTRFLQMISERRMTVSLILAPEVGVHYPNSGLPRDVISRKDNMAQHCDSASVTMNTAPNAYALPSYFAPEFNKRYYSFLTRMDNYLADLNRNQSELLRGVDIIMTGSFWKYYRSPKAAAHSPFGGPAGDFSGNATLAYRQRVEQFFNQREFADPTPSASNRWKTRNMEEINRRWFYQQSEDVHRHRTFQHLRKKSSFVPLNEIEMHAPEADPSMFYSQAMQQLTGGAADFARLSNLVDEYSARAGMACEAPSAPYIHWSGLGGFRSLADSEKQFLILKSILLMAGQGGGIFIDASDWFSFSNSFRARTESLARSVAHHDLTLKNRVLYLAPHLWSSVGTLWEELRQKLGSGARMVASLDLVLRERHSRLVVVDPQVILTRDAIAKLTAWAKSGRVVVIPRSALYTESARAELEQLIAGTKRIEIDLGLPYRLHAIGDGKLIVYDLPEGATFQKESLAAWQTFLTAILSVAEVQGYCRLSDSRLAVIPMEKRGGGLGVFVLNGSRRQVSGDLIFAGSVSVSDLAVALSAQAGHGGGSTPANRFSLEVPPCGIFPLAVDGIGLQPSDADERMLASQTMELDGQKPGSPETGGLWN